MKWAEKKINNSIPKNSLLIVIYLRIQTNRQGNGTASAWHNEFNEKRREKKTWLSDGQQLTQDTAPIDNLLRLNEKKK